MKTRFEFKYSLSYLKTIYQDMVRCDLFKHASTMAYVTLFSLIPSLAAIFGLISLFTPILGEQSVLVLKLKTFIIENLTAGAGDQVIGYIDKLLHNLNLKKIGLTGFAGILLSLVLLLRQIEIALNRVWMIHKERNALTRFIYFWTFVTLGSFIAALVIGITSGFNLADLNPFKKELEQNHFLEIIAPFLGIFTFYTLLYKIVPNCFVPIRQALVGAFIATILFSVGTEFYGLFTKNFTSFRSIYGALAAIPLFLMWLYILWVITLLGGVISWRLQQGFDIKEDMDDRNIELSAREKLRNHYLQILCPYLTLLSIYHRFRQGDGKGIRGYEISTKLNLPAPWVIDALESLKTFGFVIASYHDEAIAHEPLSRSYFPTSPPEALKVAEFLKTMSQGSKDWLLHWHHQFPLELKNAVEMIWKGHDLSLPDYNMEQVLAELPATI